MDKHNDQHFLLGSQHKDASALKARIQLHRFSLVGGDYIFSTSDSMPLMNEYGPDVFVSVVGSELS